MFCPRFPDSPPNGLGRRRVVALLVLVSLAACSHKLEIDNYPRAPLGGFSQEPRVTVGIIDAEQSEFSGSYLAAIARALQARPNIENVFYPHDPDFQPDAIAIIGVNPEYNGANSNFLVNFPGFLVFAPAWNGYKYRANPRTRVRLESSDGTRLDEFSWEHDYEFHQSDISRTWTEISWFEVGIIAFIGGIVFTSYDERQTPEFIRVVGPNYGKQIAVRITDALEEFEPLEPADHSDSPTGILPFPLDVPVTDE